VVIVLSQFCTFTVCSAMSITSPSAPNCGIEIQSPTRTMSLVAIWTLATSERMVVRNTSSSTAMRAPSPDSRNTGERPSNSDSTVTTAAIHRMIETICRYPLIGRLRAFSASAI